MTACDTNIFTMSKINGNDSRLKEIHTLYRQAFPADERIPFRILLSMRNAQRHLYAFYREDILYGFVFLYHGESFMFIHYLAVCEPYRGHGYGSMFLQMIRSADPDLPVLLEVETPDTSSAMHEQQLRRLSFYRHSGFVLTDIRYLFYGVDYTLMVCGDPVTREEYDRHFHEIWNRAIHMRYLD